MNKIFTLITSALFISMLAGCGGGGSTTTDIAYAGNESQATLDTYNAKPIVEGTVGNAQIGAGTGTGFASRQGDSAPLNLSVSRSLLRGLEAARQQQVMRSERQARSDAATVFCKNEEGTDEGSINYNLIIDDSTNAVSGDFNFIACNQDGIVIDGLLSITGTVDFSGNFQQVAMTFSSLATSIGSTSVTLNGTLEASYSGNQITIVMNVAMLNDGTGQVEKVENYLITYTNNYSYASLTISGRYYHPDYGFVEITTLSPILINNGDEYPSSGIIQLGGALGTMARVTIISNTQYFLEVDTDGDGALEVPGSTENW
ncbi:hypothetical protein [Candidatus Endoriftia persephone]|jgi:hypothetical protein|uniref:Lipoprotein n=3 Tax=Gammaproteobacteria TaxID=1236 RepID=G2FJV4_9GAMM|nr:hypothetical protein [Candidatus Endoriftia persephone]EGV50590.1 hypothetical protein Rifp1Sym_cu00160 [endosymbiont of Riftia pachyptila (vent Ph05)]EGW52926.1 hypothetical protein TevJSym_ca00060 [endosymbiont of Tevnia jerichonana (vent Tica)]USF86172.1 hypothetical protein L0Y14_08395 [Candidatus Endoriftia persephone]